MCLAACCRVTNESEFAKLAPARVRTGRCRQRQGSTAHARLRPPLLVWARPGWPGSPQSRCRGGRQASWQQFLAHMQTGPMPWPDPFHLVHSIATSNSFPWAIINTEEHIALYSTDRIFCSHDHYQTSTSSVGGIALDVANRALSFVA